MLKKLEIVEPVRAKVRNLFADQGFSEILTGSLYSIVARMVSTALGFITTMVVARFYGAEILGILAVVTSLLALTTVFTILGTSTSILRLIPEHTAKYSTSSAFHAYRKTQFFVFASSIVIGVALFLLSDLVAKSFFSKPDWSFLFTLAAVSVVFKSLMQLNTEAVRGLRLIKTFAFMQVLPGLSMLLLLVTAMNLTNDAHLPVYAQFTAWAVTAVVGIGVMHWNFKIRMLPEGPVHPTSLGDILKLSFPMLLSATMTLVIAQTGVIILGMYRTEAEVGFFFVAIKLSTLTILVLSAINSMAAPKFSELFHTGQTDEVFRVAKKSTKLIFWSTAPILLALVLLGKPLLKFAFGPEFAAAYIPLILLVGGQFVNSISGSTGIFMNMTGHQTAFRNIMLASAVLNLTLNLALIPRYGSVGAALAAAITVSSWNACTLLFIRLRYGRTIGYFPLVN